MPLISVVTAAVDIFKKTLRSHLTAIAMPPLLNSQSLFPQISK
jgi:hypothetical protein